MGAERRFGEFRVTEKVAYRVSPAIPADQVKPRFGGVITEVRNGRVVESFTTRQKVAQVAGQVRADAVTAVKATAKASAQGAVRLGRAAVGGAIRVGVGQFHQADAMGHTDLAGQVEGLTRQAGGHARRVGAGGVRGAGRAAAVVVRRLMPKSWVKDEKKTGRGKGMMRAGGRAVVSAARAGGRTLGSMGSSIRDGGHLDTDQASVRTARSMTRFTMRRAGHAGQWMAKQAMAAAIRSVIVMTKALVAVVGSAGFVLPIAGGILAVVLALCAILPSFMTGAGYANQRKVTLTGSCGGTVSFELPEQANVWMAVAEKSSGIPAAWFAAIAQRESDFRPDVFSDDRNGGTWGLFQLNHEEWSKIYDGKVPPLASWGDRGNPPPGITDPLVHAHYAGLYFKNRLARVQEMKTKHAGKPFAELSDLDALVIAHNAGEGTLELWPNISAGVKDYLTEIQTNFHPQPCGQSGGAGLAEKDDYYSWWASKGKPTSGYDPRGFAWAQCTSYAAFAVSTYSSYKDFQNNWRGQHFGDANTWNFAARAAGIRVDQTPAVGAVAQRMVGQWGHVAYIIAVHDDGSFDINEYNHVHPKEFSTRYNVRIGSGKENFDNVLHFEEGQQG